MTNEGPVRRGGRVPARTGSRVPVTLACSECKARNYRTTKGAEQGTALELKKYCKECKKHTLHRETK